MQKGNIGVTTENIFPIIKKFLYSDHEIFLRELVSNAVDATQKLNTLASIGEFKGELGDLTVHVELGKDTITISDRGIGLTAEEIEKYINQIAFSGANDFLEKYKNDADMYENEFTPKPYVRISSHRSVKRPQRGLSNRAKKQSLTQSVRPRKVGSAPGGLTACYRLTAHKKSITCSGTWI